MRSSVMPAPGRERRTNSSSIRRTLPTREPALGFRLPRTPVCFASCLRARGGLSSGTAEPCKRAVADARRTVRQRERHQPTWSAVTPLPVRATVNRRVRRDDNQIAPKPPMGPDRGWANRGRRDSAGTRLEVNDLTPLALVAQRIEQGPTKSTVAGSNPVERTILFATPVIVTR
jgi:hypothetical protein